MSSHPPPLPSPARQAVEDEGIELSPELLEIASGKPLGDLTPRQRILFAVVVHTLNAFQKERPRWWRTLLKLPWVVVVSGVLVYLILAALGFLLSRLSGLTGEWILYLWYAIPLVIGGVVGLVIKLIADEGHISFTHPDKHDWIDGLEIGRLSVYFNQTSFLIYALLLGGTLAGQVATLYFGAGVDHLKTDGRIWECVLLTLDNLCHGIFLDTFELYEINIHEKVQHTTLSATSFFLFRLAYDAYAAILIYFIFRRATTVEFLRNYPENLTTPEQLTDWLATIGSEEPSWPRRHFDEFMFLMLVRYHLMNDFDLVRKVSSQFPGLLIKGEVRALFLDENRYLLLAARDGDEYTEYRPPPTGEEPTTDEPPSE